MATVAMQPNQKNVAMATTLNLTTSTTIKQTQTGGGEVLITNSKNLITDACGVTCIYDVQVSVVAGANTSPAYIKLLNNIRDVTVTHTKTDGTIHTVKYDYQTLEDISIAHVALFGDQKTVPNLTRYVKNPPVLVSPSTQSVQWYRGIFTIPCALPPGKVQVTIHTGTTDYATADITTGAILTRTLMLETHDTNVPGEIAKSGGLYFMTQAGRVSAISLWGDGSPLVGYVVLGRTDVMGGLLNPSANGQPIGLANVNQAEIVDQIELIKDYLTPAVGYQDAPNYEVVTIMDANRATQAVSAAGAITATFVYITTADLQW